MDVDLVLRGASGLATMCYLAGMLYFGFILMRARGGRPEGVFFWTVVCQVGALGLIAVMSVVMRLFGYSMMSWGGGGGVDWIGVVSSILEGGLLLSALVGAVALVMAARPDQR
jgi:hypothetical protein